MVCDAEKGEAHSPGKIPASVDGASKLDLIFRVDRMRVGITDIESRETWKLMSGQKHPQWTMRRADMIVVMIYVSHSTHFQVDHDVDIHPAKLLRAINLEDLRENFLVEGDGLIEEIDLLHYRILPAKFCRNLSNDTLI